MNTGFQEQHKCLLGMGLRCHYNQNTHVTSPYNRQYGRKEVNHGGEALVNNNATILLSPVKTTDAVAAVVVEQLGQTYVYVVRK